MTLPRMLDDAGTVGVALRRKLSYTHAHLTANVRPNKMIIALQALIRTPLYANVILRHDWQPHQRACPDIAL